MDLSPFQEFIALNGILDGGYGCKVVVNSIYLAWPRLTGSVGDGESEFGCPIVLFHVLFDDGSLADSRGSAYDKGFESAASVTAAHGSKRLFLNVDGKCSGR